MDAEKKHFTVRIEEVGIAIFKVVAWVFLAGLFFMLFHITTYTKIKISEPDAMDFAQIARNNLRGEWFTTNLIRPVSLWTNQNITHHPDFTYPPMYSIYLTLLFSIFGAKDASLLLGSALFYFATIPILFLFAKKVFNRKVALFSILFYITNYKILGASISGLPVGMVIFFLTLLLYLVYLADERKIWLTALIGALLGICYLSKYSYGLFIFPIAVYFLLTMKTKRAVHIPILVVCFLVVVSPWLYRNYRLAGNPFFTLRSYRPYEAAVVTHREEKIADPANKVGEYGYIRSFSASVLSNRLEPVEMRNIFLRRLRRNYKEFFGLTTTNLLVVLFLAGIFYRYKSGKINTTRFLFYSMLVIEGIVLSIMFPDNIMFFPFIPFIILMGSGFFFILLEQIKPRYLGSRVAVVGIFVIVNLYFTFAKLFPNDIPRIYDSRNWNKHTIKEDISKEMTGDDLILTNVPWLTAWYADRVSIWYPPMYDDYLKLDAIVPNGIGFVYLANTSLFLNDSDYHIWLRGFQSGEMPDSFRLVLYKSSIGAGRRHFYTTFIDPEKHRQLEKVSSDEKTSESET